MVKDIKDYREKELKGYVVVNVLLILIGTGKINEIMNAVSTEEIWDAIGVLVSSGIVSTMIYIYTYILDCLLSGETKNKMIWCKKGLPGTRIFTEIQMSESSKDMRISKEIMLEKYADVYSKLEDATGGELAEIQNRAWYEAYQRTEDKPQVYVSQRDWLLCRDMCVMTLWIILGLLISIIILRVPLSCRVVGVVIFSLVEQIISWIAARIKSTRFAYNVIAKDLYMKK